MKTQRVYVDTSVIGGRRDEEFAPWSNGLMRDFRQGNFKHIVHFYKMRMFNAANIDLGYKPLQIYSPCEVTNYGED